MKRLVVAVVALSLRSANVQKIIIAEDALGYTVADRHHRTTGSRDLRTDDVGRFGS